MNVQLAKVPCKPALLLRRERLAAEKQDLVFHQQLTETVDRLLRQFLGDMATAPRVPSMVEPDAFQVGVDLAVTPGSVVLQTPVFELIQYSPATPAVRQVPLVIVPPTIEGSP